MLPSRDCSPTKADRDLRVAAFWRWILRASEPGRGRGLTGGIVGLVLVIGLADFVMGFEASLLVFYFLPVCLAVASQGWRFGVVIAVACVVTWLAGDIAAGAHYANTLVPLWNGLIALGTYLVLIWLLVGLLALNREMEERVRQRTAALTAEIAERERLEQILIETGERERRSIGRDLHDGLGQHLTGTAVTGQILIEKLEERGAGEAADARKLVRLVKAAIEQTRQLAKGLLLAEIAPDGLPPALHELAVTASAQFRVACVFECEHQVPLPEGGAATHLYRIAQEAVRNAVRHGRAQNVVVALAAAGPDALQLTIRDDGTGLPPPAGRGEGLGLRIMAHRAGIIGAGFSIETPADGGTIVSCRLVCPTTL